MEQRIDIYSRKKQLDWVTKKLRSSEQISDTNKMDIIEFQNSCFSEGLSEPRVTKYTWQLIRPVHYARE